MKIQALAQSLFYAVSFVYDRIPPPLLDRTQAIVKELTTVYLNYPNDHHAVLQLNTALLRPIAMILVAASEGTPDSIIDCVQEALTKAETELSQL